MTTFQVWAPYAEQVELDLASGRISMLAEQGGWWRLVVPSAGPGADYSFVLDGGKPLPDPRSAWQPHGVHGPSRVVDQAAFPWTDKGWRAGPLAAAVIYELHIGTFTPEGTFEAAIERLDHLVALGISHVELMPVNAFPGERGWGYDGVDLYAPHDAYGGPQGLKRLVDACHGRGLAVILDVVYNHLGPDGNYLSQYGPYFTGRYATPWGEAVNFDGPGSDEVRRFFIDNALMWLRDYHIDGLRIDAVHAIVDTSAVHILEELAAAVRNLEGELGRHLVLIAESDLNDPRLLWSPERGGYGLHAQWSDDFHHALHAVLSGEQDGYYADFGSLAQLAKALQRAFVYDGQHSAFRGRRHGRPAAGLSGHRFLGYLQNHDQIGNRARGERSSHLLPPEYLKIGAALVLTAPFVPMLFQGEEWGAETPFQYFTAHQDAGLGRAVSEGRRREFAAFGWDPEQVPDPQAVETFQRSRLNWQALSETPHATLLDWHRRLIRLRRATPALTDGRLDQIAVHFDEQAKWLIVDRGSVIIACNLAEQAQHLSLGKGRARRLLLGSAPQIRLAGDRLSLPPGSVAIVSQ